MCKIIIGLFFLWYPLFINGKDTEQIHPLKHTPIDISNIASLQRGAKYFMNFCSGCHSLRFMRYNRLAADLKITDINPVASDQRLNSNLIFTQANPNDFIKSSLHKENALLWFGKYPPDLSLTTRARSTDWVYNYLLSFYLDKTRPFGVNNRLLKNTAMPDPLAILRKNTRNYQSKIKTNNLNQLLVNTNHKKTFELEEVVADLVNFLAYTAEPTKTSRQSLGLKVCGFLLFFSCVVYFLKKQIWANT
ncbi:MAG: cytochrome c1 [Pseudomonadota bacterium]